MFGSNPPGPPPLPPPPPPIEDSAEQEEIARKRRALESKRAGRSSLVINPQRGTGGGTGLRIPPG